MVYHNIIMKAIERPLTLKDAALKELRDAISSGTLGPGERLVERSLCQQLGVSRTVIRECIRHLESEKLVNTVPNAGPVVATLSASEVKEIYRIRSLLESEAAGIAAQNITPQHGKALRQLMTEIRNALEMGDVDQALAHTTKLYDIIFNLADMVVSLELIEHLNGRINRLRRLSLSNKQRRKAGPRSLNAMVKAICKGDGDGADKASKIHIDQAMQASVLNLD